MPTLAELQQEIGRARAAAASAVDAYYQALQRWSLTGEGAERLRPLRQARDEAEAAVGSAIGALAALGDPQQLIEQVPADSPFLLLPLRLEARYLTRRHVLRDLSSDDVVDTSGLGLPRMDPATGFQAGDDGETSYRIPSLGAMRGPQPAMAALEQAALNVRSGRFILRQADREELWIRIYPDEIFTDALERSLQPAEAEAGRSFWREVWSGEDAEEAWLRLVDGTTVARAGWILQATRPTNFTPEPAPGTEPRFPDVTLKDGPYTQAPVTRLLPERFVVRLARGNVVKELIGAVVPEPLPLGLDPTLDPLAEDRAAEFAPAGAGLDAPAPLRWVHDLEAAEQAGLAIRVDLEQHPEFRDGVDSLVVLGAKLSAGGEEGGRLLDTHLTNCLYKEDGFGILRQGTPTNRTGGQPAPQDREADARRFFRALWTLDTDPNSDGGRLRRALGLSAALPLPDGHAQDIEEALLINRTLWPATFGYFLLQFFTPALGEPARERVRVFFSRWVSGRGLLPVLRLNSQPYGIVPTTSFAHWQYGPPATDADRFLSDLWLGYLSPLNAQWQAMVAQVEGEAASAAGSHRLDEAFLRAVGLTASAGGFERQLMVSPGLQEILRFIQPSTAATLAQEPSFNPAARAAELSSAGLDPAQFQALSEGYASPRDSRRVGTVLVDVEPLSEDRELQHLAGKAWNYLDWLAQARLVNLWNHEFGDAPAGDGPAEGNPGPDTLLARLCRQAVLRTFLESGLRTVEPNPGLWLLKARDFETERLHDQRIVVNPAVLDRENFLHRHYAPVLRRFGVSAPFTLEPDRWRYLEPIAGTLEQADGNPALASIREIRAGLARLARLPTVRLRRLLTEHLDLCSHRLDAWLLGLVSERLEKQRGARPTGIGIGAFGCLLNLRPNAQRAVRFVEAAPEFIPATAENLPRAAVPVANLALAAERRIAPDRNWDRVFFYLGDQPEPGVSLDIGTGVLQPSAGVNDAGSSGFLHAPSTTHAAAMAILYAGHLSHRHDTAADSLAIKLTPGRTRTALELLRGMQEGASLAELLGHRLERAIHESGLDGFLLDIRTAFPLRHEATNGAGPRPLVTTDGLKVLEASRANPVPATVAAIAPAVADIDDALDAVGDLLLAESVFQASKGNTERAAAALRTLNSGGQVIPPEFIRTPQRGVVINHRVGVVLEQGGAAANLWTDAPSPRASLAPGLNRWLARQLPAPDRTVIPVTLPDGTRRTVSVAGLGLEPLDFLYACPESRDRADRSPLALAVELKARELFQVAEARVDLRSRAGLGQAEVSAFEVGAQAACLRKLVNQCRPIEAGDFRAPGTRGGAAPQLDPARVRATLNRLRAEDGPLAGAAQRLRQAAADEERVRPALLQAWLHGAGDAGASGADSAAAERVSAELEQKRIALAAAMDAIPADLAGAPLVQRLAAAAATVFGGTVPVVPDVRLENAGEIREALEGRALLENASPGEVDRWMQEAALARHPLRAYRRTVLLREALQAAGAAASPAIIQLPFRAGRPQPWIGGRFSPDTAMEDLAFTSLALELPPGFAADRPLAGMIVDEWPEFVPSRVAETGVALHYNQPNSEPPQVMLLAVTPVEGGAWRWEHLTGAVLEALQLARKRLTTPAHIAARNAAIGQLLPGVMLPVTPGGNQIPAVEIG
jgi:hypothetical protein